jgi:peptidoglycan/xylan/chitin deacetylase (PgdA/CDA1 family)
MRVTALLYHDVVPDDRYDTSGFQSADADIYKLSCAEFRRHLDVLATQDRVKPRLIGGPGTAGTERCLLITFDDGGISAALHTAPMLEEYGWRAYFFMTTDYIGAPGFLGQKELRALSSSGHVIGSHSCSHPPRMAACSTAQLEREWKDSVRRLEDVLGVPVTTASVPAGSYSRRIACTAGEAGIRTLFTSEPVTRTQRVAGVTTIGRFSVQQGVSADWVARVVADERLPRFGRYVAWNGKKVLKAVGGPVWLSFRKSVFAARAKRRIV